MGVADPSCLLLFIVMVFMQYANYYAMANYKLLHPIYF